MRKSKGFMRKCIKCLILLLLFATPAFPRAAKKIVKKEAKKPQVVKKRLMLKGCIKSPNSWKKVPEFRIFYEGKQTINDNNGFYSFPLDEKIKKGYLLICKNLNHNYDNINTIENLSIDFEKPYKYFSFKQTGTDNKDWIQKEKKLDKKNFIIPSNCITMVINPKYVDSVNNWSVKLADNFIKLPQITLKEDFEEKRVKREAAKSLLRTLDSSVFHEKVEVTKKNVMPNTRISMVR